MPINPREYFGFHRGVGDPTHRFNAELLLPAEGTGTHERSLHIAQASAANTDWNVAANAHPTVYIHSTTTPATDYISMYHNATTGFIGAVGGTLDLTGVCSVTVNDASADVDFRVEGANNANMIVSDGGTDSLGLGGTVTTGAFLTITPAAQTRDAVTAVGNFIHIPADSQDVNAAGNCATVAVGAAIYVGVPTWTATATGFTFTDSATLHIAGKPVDSTNVTNTREYGILVECGGIGVGIPGGTTGCVRYAGGTSGVVTTTVAAAAGTWTFTYPTAVPACCGMQLAATTAGVGSWTAAASVREVKNILGEVCRDEAYSNIINAPVYRFTYKDEFKENISFANSMYPFTGIMADESPWAMQGERNRIFSPINAFGNLTAAFQVLAEKVEDLENARTN